MVRRTIRTIHTLIIGMALAACGSPAAPTSPALTPRPTSQPAAESSPVPAAPASTQAAPAAPTPAAIPTAPASTQAAPAAPQPTPAGSAEATWPEPTATPAFPEQQITAANVGQVELLRTVGFGQAQDAAFSPDQRRLAVATTGGIVWYALPGLRHLRFDPIEGGVNYIRFIDSQTIESITDLLFADDQVQTRRVDDGSLIESRIEQNAAPIWVPRVESPDGDLVATFPPLDSVPVFGVTIVRQSDGVTLYEDTETARIDFAADSQTVALVTDRGAVRIIDLLANQTDEVVLPGYSAAAFSPDGQTLVTSGRDLTLWDVVSGELKQRDPIAFSSAFGMRGTTQRIAYSPDGSTLTVDGAYSVFEGEIRTGSTWNIVSGGVEFAGDTLIGGEGIMNHGTYVGAVSPAGHIGAFTSDGTTLEIYQNRALLHTLTWADPITRLAFSPDGATLAVGGPQGGVELITVSDGSVIATIDGIGVVDRFGFSPDGRLLAVGSEDGKVSVIDVATARISASIPSVWAGARLIFSADNSLLLEADRDQVHVYGVGEGRLLHTLPESGDAIAIGPNRRLLLILRDGYVQLWGIR